MRNLKFPDSGGQLDDQILETDIMRFVAIIGIVFWILFALVKTLPVQITESPGLVDPPSVKAPVPVAVTSPLKTKTVPLPAAVIKATDPPPTEQAPPNEIMFGVAAVEPEPTMHPLVPDKTGVPTGEQVAATSLPIQSTDPHGLLLQFASREDLLALLNEKRIRLFGRAQASGFDLFFSGELAGDGISFKSVRELPHVLWEIRSGADHGYFLDLLARNFPAIRTFPNQQIFVSFTDTGLGQLVDKTFDNARAAARDGILSVTRHGDVVFEELTKNRGGKT